MNKKPLREALMAEGYSPTHCGVCATSLEPNPPNLFRRRRGQKYSHSVIDHNHKTGFCRGFLCASCNTLLTWISSPDDLREHIVLNLKLETPAPKVWLANDGKLYWAALAYVSQQSSVKYR